MISIILTVYITVVIIQLWVYYCIVDGKITDMELGDLITIIIWPFWALYFLAEKIFKL